MAQGPRTAHLQIHHRHIIFNRHRLSTITSNEQPHFHTSPAAPRIDLFTPRQRAPRTRSTSIERETMRTKARSLHAFPPRASPLCAVMSTTDHAHSTDPTRFHRSSEPDRPEKEGNDPANQKNEDQQGHSRLGKEHLPKGRNNESVAAGKREHDGRILRWRGGQRCEG